MRNYIDIFDLSNKNTLSIDFLNTLIIKHLNTFTFSSINVLLKKDLSLNTQDIERRFLNSDGGYCFEHNKLFYTLLNELGFEVKSYFARVLLNKNIDVGKTHRFNIVIIDNISYLVDVGFGAYSPSSAIKLSKNNTITSNKLSYNITKEQNHTYFLNLSNADKNFILYSFDFMNYNEVDFELGHFYSHKHPNANFVKNLVLSLQKGTKTYSLINLDYTVYDLGKAVYTNKIENIDEFDNIIKTIFLYKLTSDEINLLFIFISKRNL